MECNFDDYIDTFVLTHMSVLPCSCRRQLTRRCMSLRFTCSDDAILVADKSGDAYSFSTTSPEDDGRLLLGHVSMLLDLVSVTASGPTLSGGDMSCHLELKNYKTTLN